MSKEYILTSKTGIVTARTLADSLGIIARINPRHNPPKIRWGSSLGNYEEDTNYNSKEHIENVSNKVIFSNIAKESALMSLEYMKGSLPESYPVFVRTLLNSYGGKGIVIANNEEEYLPYRQYYYTLFERFSFELRVHILGGVIKKIFKKIKVDDEEEENVPIRNLSKGYHFSLKEVANYPKLVPFVENFYNKFPINMVGLDLGYSREKESYIIIEANSCPSLNHETLDIYTEFLSDKI